MLTATFKDGTVLPYLECIETEEYWNGSPRRVLKFECAPDAVGLDALCAALTDPANTAEIQLFNDEADTTNIYTDYCILIKCAVEPKTTTNETGAVLETAGNRLFVQLGKYTILESQLIRQADRIEEIHAQVAYTAMMFDTLLEEE